MCQAIASHHGDEGGRSRRRCSIHIVAAANSLSAARPGARREQLASYIKRLDDLEAICKRFGGVERAYALQAGREIRVMVMNDQVDDAQAIVMSKEIARAIENAGDVSGPRCGWWWCARRAPSDYAAERRRCLRRPGERNAGTRAPRSIARALARKTTVSVSPRPAAPELGRAPMIDDRGNDRRRLAQRVRWWRILRLPAAAWCIDELGLVRADDELAQRDEQQRAGLRQRPDPRARDRC
mgnify:CR=1 FL=1